MDHGVYVSLPCIACIPGAITVGDSGLCFYVPAMRVISADCVLENAAVFVCMQRECLN